MILKPADAEALKSLHGNAHRIEPKVALYGGTGRIPDAGALIDGDIEVSDFSWTWDETGFSGSLTLPNLNSDEPWGYDRPRRTIEPWGHRLRMRVHVTRQDGTAVTVPLPWGVVTETVEQDPEGTLQVSFRGLEAMLEQTQLLADRPTKYEKDRTVRHWMTALLDESSPGLAWTDSGRLITPDRLPAGTRWSAGTSVWEAVQDLAVAAGGRLQFDTEGRLVVMPLLPGGDRMPGVGTKASPAWTIERGVNLIALTRTKSREGLVNKVAVKLKDSNIPTAKPKPGTPGTPGSPGTGDGGTLDVTFSPVQPIQRVQAGGPQAGRPTTVPGMDVGTTKWYSNGRDYHGAWDVKADFGTAVYAPLNAKVAKVVEGNPDYTGVSSDANYVLLHAYSVDRVYQDWYVADAPAQKYQVVEKGDKITIILWHLRQNRVAVQEGEVIPAGTLVGEVGMSGRTTGPHLHIAVQTGWNSSYVQAPSWGSAVTVYPPGGVWGQRNYDEGIFAGNNALHDFISEFALFANKPGDSSTTTPAVAVDTTGPERFDGPMGRATEWVQEDRIDPKEGADLAEAKTRLAIRSARRLRVEAQTLVLPHLAPGDVVDIKGPDDEKGRPHVVGSVDCSIPFTSMRVSLREVQA